MTIGVIDSQLATSRGRTGGFSVGAAGASTDISAHASPGEFRISLDGAALATVSIVTAGLTTGILIAAALQAAIRSMTAWGPRATQARVVFSATQARYVLISGTRGATSQIVIADGLANDIAADLKIGVAQGGSEMDGAEDLDQAILLLSLGVNVIPYSFDAVGRITGANSAVRGMGYATVHDIAAGGGGADDLNISAAAPTRDAKVAMAFLEVTTAGAGGSTATLKTGAGGTALSAALSTAATGTVTALGSGSTRTTAHGLVLTRSDSTAVGRLVILWTLQ